MLIRKFQRWLLAQSAAWLTVLALLAWSVASGVDLSAILWLASGLGIVSFALLWRVLWAGSTLADRVTLARFLGLAAVCGATGIHGRVDLPIWIAMAIVTCLDAVDGWCARRFGGSEHGAILDMETDQLTVLGFSILATVYVGAGVWLLALPACRYFNVVCLWIFEKPISDPKPRAGKNAQARVIHASVMVLLLVCTFPQATDVLRVIAGAVAVVLLLYSYASDALYLAQQPKQDTSAVK